LDLDHFLPGKKLIFFNVLLQVKSSHLGSWSLLSRSLNHSLSLSLLSRSLR
jgi:hypothetical protein